MLHTMAFPGFGRTHDDALALASSIADRTFSAVLLVNGQRVSQFSTFLLPDPAPSLKQIALVYVLDLPPGAAEALDARRTELVQEALATFRALLTQVFFPFRAALCLSTEHRATRQLGPYTITAQQDTPYMYRVLVALRNQEPHVSELCGSFDKCEEFLKEKGIPLDGWCASEASEQKQETGT
jgi:hypothetical protein